MICASVTSFYLIHNTGFDCQNTAVFTNVQEREERSRQKQRKRHASETAEEPRFRNSGRVKRSEEKETGPGMQHVAQSALTREVKLHTCLSSVVGWGSPTPP